MFFVCHKLQVLKSVVAPVVVDVVDYLIFCKIPPDVFLHHQPMLHHQPIRVATGVIRNKDADVTV